MAIEACHDAIVKSGEREFAKRRLVIASHVISDKMAVDGAGAAVAEIEDAAKVLWEMDTKTK